MSAEDKLRDINIKKGNYNEFIQGHYINGDYIETKNFSPPITGFPQNIPRSNTDKFVGRQKELVEIHQQLVRQEKAIITHVEGMGGIGKTELAIVYSLISLEHDNYPGGICWLRCREENIGLKIVEFARTKLNLNPPEDLELPARVDWCWQRWREGETLIVFDDVTKYKNIKPYLPEQSSHFKILITTRLKLDSNKPIYLETLSEKEALELLSELVGSEKVNQELAIAKKLCQRLGCLPLALQLVGRYVKEREISLSEELQRLKRKGLEHPSTEVPDDDPTWVIDIERGVKLAFDLSWLELTEPAQKLGCLLSLFALAPIPWSLVENIAGGQEPEELENIRVELEKLHLLEGKKNYQLHQLIQEFFRDKQKKLVNAEEQKANFFTAIAEVAREIPETVTLENVNYFAPFIPHLAKTATFYQDSLSDEDLIDPFVGLGRFYEGQGAYEQALIWRKQSLSVAQKRFGELHLSVAKSINNLATLYNYQGRYTEAETLFLKSLELHKELRGESHIDVARSFNNLANNYRNQGRYSEAETLFLKSLELKKELLGELDTEIALGLNNLADLYNLQGRYTEAETLYLKALEVYKKLREESHIDVVTVLDNLALLYYNQGRYSEAETLFLQVLERRKKLLGESHPDISISLNNLASLYRIQERYAEAELLCLQALELDKERLGESHPSIATDLNNLARIYRDQRRNEEAETLYLRALELRKELLGESHPNVATSLNNLASLYHDQGRKEEAETLYLRALELKKERLGESHPNVATGLNNLAKFYEDQGRDEEAKPLYRQAIKIAETTLGKNHTNTIVISNNLQKILEKMNNKK